MIVALRRARREGLMMTAAAESSTALLQSFADKVLPSLPAWNGRFSCGNGCTKDCISKASSLV